MGFFASHNYSAMETLRSFSRRLLLKMAGIALAWVGIYFLTQLMRGELLTLFNPLVGALAGLVFGWKLAENSVETSGLTGMTLWVVLTMAGAVPVFVVEGVLNLITGYEVGFGRWMCITAALIMTMAAAVWRASIDD